MTHLEPESAPSPVLVCLDGSPDADAAAVLALAFARSRNLPVTAAHIYDARIHESRFRQMEPGLPEKYQAVEGLKDLRDSHGTLMSDGFQALSRGYMDPFLTRAREQGVAVRVMVEEGRNYVGLGRIARQTRPGLSALGATGLGATGDGMLGSTAARLLRSFSGDLLIGRATAPTAGPVLACIDGSRDALAALGAAREFALLDGRALHLVSVYDPFLHQRVFKAMADTMLPEAQAAVGLDKQQDLHESLIDDGLGALYRTFLEDAAGQCLAAGLEPVTHLVADKGYRGIIRKAEEIQAALICLGRFGHNREDGSEIGATAEAVVRLAACHVHLNAPPRKPGASPGEQEEEGEMPWEPEALERLERVPRFVRKMARRSIETAAREEGARSVTVKHVDLVSERFRPKKGKKP